MKQEIIQGDCLEVMKTFPDKHFDLVLTDPPYGIDIGKMSFTSGKEGGVAKRKDYRGMADWDKYKITSEIMTEIMRVSKNQIIFGGNYYTEMLPPTKSWIVWDKKTDEKYSNDFADCELAWASSGQARVFRFLWSGMLQENMKNKEIRYHPTQKPIELMKWCLQRYAKDGDTILDPFLGSGTTLLASKALGLTATGIEISPEYCEVARKRLEQDSLF